MPSSKGRSRRHSHKQKTRDIDGFSRYMAHKVCDTCGKQCYLSRAEARHSARVNHPGQAMHVYKCQEASGRVWWHTSSIPADRLAEEIAQRGQRHRELG
jgi:hypothetical protein